ncbi:MAG: hypothetical protein IIU49_00285 [Spirochaetales bacterium]|nr:hypothetical protein [Spirochaetales bacterium]
MSQSGLVYIDGADWNRWKADMERLGESFGYAADKTLAFIGDEGRKEIGAEERQKFHFGAVQKKWKPKEGEYVTQRFSTYNAKHGWYMTRNKRRMIGFSFENALSYQERKMKRLNSTVSQGYVYSLMANLWNQDVVYTKNSPGFHREGYTDGNGKARMGGWGRGYHRAARPVLSSGKVREGLAKAMPRAEQALKEIIRREGF